MAAIVSRNNLFPTIFTACIHVVILVALFWSWHVMPPTLPSPPLSIKAKLIKMNAVPARMRPRPVDKKAPVAPRHDVQEEPEPPKPQPKPEPQKQEEQKKQEEQQKQINLAKKQEQEKKDKAEAEKKKQDDLKQQVEIEKKKQDEEKKKAEADKKKKEQEDKKKAEEKKKREAEALRKKLAEQRKHELARELTFLIDIHKCLMLGIVRKHDAGNGDHAGPRRARKAQSKTDRLAVGKEFRFPPFGTDLFPVDNDLQPRRKKSANRSGAAGKKREVVQPLDRRNAQVMRNIKVVNDE